MALNSRKVLSKAKELQNSVKTIKSDMNSLRQAHIFQMAELEASMSHTSHRILAAVSAFSRSSRMQAGGDGGGAGGVEPFRRERLEVEGLEEGYNKCCEATFRDLQ